jgi:hypothetical protein
MHATLTGPDRRTGHLARYDLVGLGIAGQRCLTLWAADADARSGVSPDEVYEVEHDSGHRGGPVRAGALARFFGPISPVRQAANHFGFQARIRPVLDHAPGLVRYLMLWQPATRSAVGVSLADSVESLQAIGVAVNSTELLPDEDPALITGPDRVDIFLTAELETTK